MSKRSKHFYAFGNFVIDTANGLLLRDGEEVPLQSKAFEVLLCLVEHGGEVMTKEELMEAVWPDTYVAEDNLTQHIHRLRRLLNGDSQAQQQFIRTVPGRGYRFVAPVNVIDQGADEVVVETYTVSRIVAEEDVIVADESSQEAAGSDPARQLPSQPSRGERLAGRLKRYALAAILASLLVAGVIGAGLYLARSDSARADLAVARLAYLTSYEGREDMASFSPDGKQAAFAWDGGDGGDLDIYVKLLEAGPPLRLTSDPADEGYPGWSPDGQRLAFARKTADRYAIYVIPVLGGVERRLGECEMGQLSWSPDGEFLACAARPSPEDQRSIVLIATKTGEVRRLTRPEQRSIDHAPAYSVDGKQLAFIRSRDLTVNELYVTSLEGGEPKQLTFDNRQVQGLAWTADGEEIIFSSNRAGSLALWRISVAGGTPVRIPGPGQGASSPAASLQGHRLAYTESARDTNIYLFETAQANGRNNSSSLAAPRRLIASTRQDSSPHFSPDGSRITFVSYRSGACEIWVCDSDGGNLLQLTSFGGLQAGSPRFSPDGKRIAFDANFEDNADIFIINVEGGKPQRLTTEPGLDILPNWSHDGQWINFCSRRSGAFEIWRMPASGGEAIQVTRNGGFESFSSPDGRYIYFTRDRRPQGVWRIPVEGGEETFIPELDKVGNWRYWSVTNSGIYFVPYEEGAKPAIKFFDFATREVKLIASPQKEPFWGPPGLTVSPDEKWILYTQLDHSGSDIMVIENFR